MLVNTQAELMYPSLAGLGCANCFGTCCSSDKGMGGLGAGSGWDSWYCQGVAAPFLFDWCVPPTPNEMVQDTSNYGANLTPENRARATAMAQEIVNNDPSLQPDGINTNWLLIGGVVLGVIVLIKKI